MKTSIRISSLILCTVFLLISGCASSGNEKLAKTSPESLKKLLVKGTTTKEQVKELLGEPTDVDFHHDGSEKWTYLHKKSQVMVRNFIPIVNYFSSGTDDEKQNLLYYSKTL